MRDTSYRLGKYKLLRGWPLRVIIRPHADATQLIEENRIQLEMRLLEQPGKIEDVQYQELSPLANTQVFRSEIDTSLLQTGVYEIAFTMWDGEVIEVPELVWILDDKTNENLRSEVFGEKAAESTRLIGYEAMAGVIGRLVREMCDSEFEEDEKWMIGKIPDQPWRRSSFGGGGGAVEAGRMTWVVGTFLEEFRYVAMIGLRDEADWSLAVTDETWEFAVRASLPEPISIGFRRALKDSDLFHINLRGAIPGYTYSVEAQPGGRDVTMKVTFQIG
jgi:hypothetical protein